MSTVVVASSEQDAAAVQAVEHHHAELAEAITRLVDAVVRSAGRPDCAAATSAATGALVSFCDSDLLPHADAEEQVLYPAAHDDPRARLLVDGMVGEHRVLVGLVDELRAGPPPVQAAAAATALVVLFRSHLDKENHLVLPLLAASPEVSLADLLSGMHELLGSHEEAESSGCGGDCGCGESSDAGSAPELDVRTVPHEIRHATVLGALGSVDVGGAMVLVAPHDPQRLLAQVDRRWPGAFHVDYLERGPDAWRLRLDRLAR